MSAAIAMAPSPAPHDRPSFPAELPPAPAGPAHSSSSAANTSAPAPLTSPAAQRTLAPLGTYRTGSGSPKGAAGAPPKSSPSASRVSGPKIIVKKEPASPDLPAPRHRPRKLDLATNKHNLPLGPQTARPLGARDGLARLDVQEVGIACLSPGFVTKDPLMQEQLQRSMSVREQQRHIIEARLHQQSVKGPSDGEDRDSMGNFSATTPGLSSSRRKKAPGLTIVAPSHEQFANERVIQSAPLGQTFTGMNKPHPLSRHITNQPQSMSNTSHIHHVPATQTQNRLPPISDVFGKSLSGHPDSNQARPPFFPSSQAPLASPGHPPPQQIPQMPMSARAREFKSAEEAQAELSGGRPELLPKLVHYGSGQPPTPPSPHPSAHTADASRSARRRTRAEYEEGASPPLGTQPAPRRVPFGEGRDSPETTRKKKEEFLRLCDRAWDLFHS